MSKVTQIFLITTGIALVVFSFWFKLGTNSQGALAKVGYLSVERGQVWTLSTTDQTRMAVDKRSSLHLEQQVETGPDSEAILELDSQFTVRVFENSLVLFSIEDKNHVLHVLRGQINFEKYGKEGTLTVAEAGRRIEPMNYQNLAQPNIVDIDQTNAAVAEVTPYESQAQAPSPATTKNPALRGGPLSEESIHQTLKAYSPAFFKCYASVLQKNQNAQEVTVSFTIEPSGKIIQPEIMRSTIEDEDFKKCLKEAFRRAEFKPFDGKAFQAVYPIKFQ